MGGEGHTTIRVREVTREKLEQYMRGLESFDSVVTRLIKNMEENKK